MDDYAKNQKIHMQAKAEEAEPIMQFFRYEHLPPHLQEIAKHFAYLARELVYEGKLPRNAERSVMLRKLLEAKDAAVRAAVAE